MFRCNNPNCKNDNSGLNRYCSYCGHSLQVPQPWAIAGGNEKRTSCLGGPYPDQFRIIHMSDHRIPIDNSGGYDIPHPIMAGNIYWTIDTIGNKLKGYPLQPDDRQWTIGPSFELTLPAAGRCDFSSTPAFDGVCLNLLVDGRFRRLSAARGRFEGKTLKDDGFKKTQKAAPLVASLENPENPYRNQRFYIHPLAEEILVVDITVIGEEDYHTIPWENPDRIDEIRSPLLVGNQVYLLTKNGRLFIMDLNADYDHLKREIKRLTHTAYLENHYCCAPTILGHHIIFEVIAKRYEDQYNEPYHERGVASFDCHTRQFKIEYFSPKLFKTRNEFEQTGHLSCLTDGEAAYVPHEGNGFDFSYLLPDQGLKPRKLNHGGGGASIFSIWDSVVIDGRLYHFDYAKRRILTWRLPDGLEFNLIPVPGPPATSYDYDINLRPPISYGKNLVLFLDRHLCFIPV